MMNQNKVLFIGLVWPEPTSSAAGKRILQLVDLFISQSFEVIFVSSATKNEMSADLESRGVRERKIELNDYEFNEFVRNMNPSIVVFDRFVSEEQFGWRVRQECPNTFQILDTEDLHLLRSARERAYKKNETANPYNEISKREIASILRCDLSLMISEMEIELLKNNFQIPSFLLFYLPFLEKIRTDYLLQLKTFDERKDFVFIGNFLHEPNWQTVLYLNQVAWPKIKKILPNTNLHIYGAYPSPKVFGLGDVNKGFFVHGKADNALEVIREARVMLAPLVFGAGQKGKFIDAMTAGTPIATNSIGSESMFDSKIPGFVEDDLDEFIQKSVELYQNESLWKKAQLNGWEILQEKFDKQLFETTFFQRVNEIQSNLLQHRNQNFIGQILKINQFNALKYMSLWIEEKNK
ncbi:MAG: glycosyltransferase family 4 protein [Moheibacter sp.]